MFVIVYRYTPRSAFDRSTLVELYSRVSQAYASAGCVASRLLAPADSTGEWLDMAWYESEEMFHVVQQRLESADLIGKYFEEFCRLTGLNESTIKMAQYEEAAAEVRGVSR